MINLIVSLVLMGSFAHANVNDLSTWSSDRTSAQAHLYSVLENAAQIDENSKAPLNFIIRNGHTLTIETSKATLFCETESEKYRCVLKGRVSFWTVNSRSVQAVLYDALETVFYDQSKSYRGIVKRAGAALVLKDKKTTLVCFSKTLGSEQVQSYFCRIN